MSLKLSTPRLDEQSIAISKDLSKLLNRGHLHGVMQRSYTLAISMLVFPI